MSLTCTGPFWGPGKSPNNFSTCYVCFWKLCKIRYCNHDWLRPLLSFSQTSSWSLSLEKCGIGGASATFGIMLKGSWLRDTFGLDLIESIYVLWNHFHYSHVIARCPAAGTASRNTLTTCFANHLPFWLEIAGPEVILKYVHVLWCLIPELCR